jgi:hypothetical protein
MAKLLIEVEPPPVLRYDGFARGHLTAFAAEAVFCETPLAASTAGGFLFLVKV